MFRQFVSKISLTFTALLVGLFVLTASPLLAAPYGEGSYGGCQYSENCSTDSNTGVANGNTGGTSSGADTSTSSDDQSAKTDKTPNTGVEPTLEAAGKEETGSGVYWWQYLSLFLLIALLVWWFIIALKRRKKEDEPDELNQVK